MCTGLLHSKKYQFDDSKFKISILLSVLFVNRFYCKDKIEREIDGYYLFSVPYQKKTEHLRNHFGVRLYVYHSGFSLILFDIYKIKIWHKDRSLCLVTAV